MVSREEMGCLEQKLWIWTLLLSGVLADPEPYSVVYPGPICAVTGSTVTIPCTYSYPKEAIDKIERVLWCVDHEICQETTPSIYDSASNRNDQRYTYIGDKKNNCSLKINNVDKIRTKIYRFRMETSIPGGSFTGISGVNITVVEPREMTVINPRGNNLVRRSDDVTLTCRTLGDCSTDQLAITWYHDNQTLPENGPSLRLNSVTTSDSGEYSCALKNSLLSHSQSFYLSVDSVLADPEPYSVVYPGPICAVTGSTVTIPCTYSYPTEAIDKIERVVWCVDHEICHGSAPSIYDSASNRNDPRYIYIGDKKNNCSLKINNVYKRHTKTYRFRMETSILGGRFTGISGVNITFVEPREMTVINPRGNNLIRRSDDVTLTCRTLGDCSTDQLAITWYHDNQTLPENGPSLHLNPVTTSDSGEYSCALKNSPLSHRQLFYLFVDNNTGPSHTTLVVAIVIGVLVGVIILAVLCFIHRRRASLYMERAVPDPLQTPDAVNHQQSTDLYQSLGQQSTDLYQSLDKQAARQSKSLKLESADAIYVNTV